MKEKLLVNFSGLFESQEQLLEVIDLWKANLVKDFASSSANWNVYSKNPEFDSFVHYLHGNSGKLHDLLYVKLTLPPVVPDSYGKLSEGSDDRISSEGYKED